MEVKQPVSGLISPRPRVFDRSYFSCFTFFKVKSDLILHEKHTLVGSNTSVAGFLLRWALLRTSAFVVIT